MNNQKQIIKQVLMDFFPSGEIVTVEEEDADLLATAIDDALIKGLNKK